MWKAIKITLLVLLGTALFFWLVQWVATNLGQPWLWMEHIGYEQIFWGVLAIKWPLVGITFALVFAWTWLNLRHARRVIANLDEGDATPQGISRRSEIPPRIKVWLNALVVMALSWYSATRISLSWKTCLNFRWGENFGQIDPIFSRDIGYYVFSLPFYQMLQSNLTRLLLIQLALILFVYAYSGCIHLSWKRPWVWIKNRSIAKQLSLHLLLAACLFGWKFYLDRFALLTSSTGVVYGVGYTADHVQSTTLIIMAVVSFLLAVVIAAGFFARRFKIIVPAVFSAFALYLILVVAIPGLVQTYMVEPNELQIETPYLKHNIAFTRKAFKLEEVEVKPYPASKLLTSADLADNQQTIDNIPIWEPRSLLPSLRQTQEMRQYYQFYNADVDRYHLANSYQQVLVSTRELAFALPPKARTWVNKHLQFTHGYGMVMSFDSKKEIGGLPLYVIDDIPPKSAHGLQIDQPAIYYGEKMPGFRIVNAGVKEFDYPKGKNNVYTSYRGTGGVPLNSVVRRLLFALAQNDINILLSSYLRPESRIQFWRQVRQRVHNIVPFLALDNNPYPVLSEGRLYWIQDAYTVSPRFPYTAPQPSPIGWMSYIRNSVKAIVDAYNGTVEFYVLDASDPILVAYCKAFPGMFKPLSALSDDLQQHLRYPNDLFAVQSDVFRSYHMIDPQVFYNQEDLWSYGLKNRPKPPKKKARRTNRLAKPKPPKTLRPYFLLARLPGSQALEFLILTLFTPKDRDNMIAWMTAKCDFPDYGHLIVYELPKEHLSYGPAQVQAMINQNTYISQQLSLWDQKGSRVITGDLIAVPLADSFLYVEPVYLTAVNLNLPELKRVIAVQGSRVVMAPSLQEAVEAVVGVTRPHSASQLPLSPKPDVCLKTEEKIRATFSRAEQALQNNDWQVFGKAMAKLHDVLMPRPQSQTTTSFAGATTSD